MRSRSKGVAGIFGLVALAFGLLMLVITQGLGGTLLGEMSGSVSYTDNEVNNETFNATSSPFNYTTSNVKQGIEDAQAYNSTAQTTEIPTEILDKDTGKVKVSDVDISATNSIDYTYNTEGTGHDIIDQGQTDIKDFAGWNSLIILMVVITFILGLLLTKFRGVFAGGGSGV